MNVVAQQKLPESFHINPTSVNLNSFCFAKMTLNHNILFDAILKVPIGIDERSRF